MAANSMVYSNPLFDMESILYVQTGEPWLEVGGFLSGDMLIPIQ